MRTYSVIIPAYNAEKILEKTVVSAINQTIVPFEIIIIDDASTDNTYGLMKKLELRYPIIKTYQNEFNLNVAETRNKGFDLVQGDYIALLDADDVWEPNKIEKQLELMEESKCDFSYTGYYLVNENGKRFGKDYEVPTALEYKKLLKENYIGCSTVVMKKEIAQNYKMDKTYSHEDYVLWLTLLRDGKKARGINEPLMQYKVSQDSRSGDKKSAAKNRWIIYRDFLEMNLFLRVYYFLIYAVKAMKKHKANLM